MYTDSFIVYIKTDDVYKHNAQNLKTRFDTSNYELDTPLPKESQMGKIWQNLLHHEQKRIANRLNIDDSSDDKKAKDTRKYVIKGKFKFENYKNCVEATQLENKTSHLDKKRTKLTYIVL